MSNYRIKRIKTQAYEKQSQEKQSLYKPTKELIPQGLKLKMISNILQYIHKSIDYQHMQTPQIEQQQKMLFQHIKALNEYINDLIIDHRKCKQTIQQIKQEKIKEFEMIQQRVICNDKTIDMLKFEYNSLMIKNRKFSEVEMRYEIQKRIQQDFEKIKHLKMQIKKSNRKNVLTEKKILHGEKNSDKPYIDLKEQYLEFLRKKDKISQRIQKTEEQIANITYGEPQIDIEYYSVKGILEKYEQMNNQTKTNHNLDMYNIQKKKMELALKKNQREDQIQKRKYYHKLKDLQQTIEKFTKLDSKQVQLQQNIINSKQKIKFFSSMLAKMNEQQDNFSYQGFLITQLQIKETQRQNKIPSFVKQKDKKRSYTEFVSNQQHYERQKWKLGNSSDIKQSSQKIQQDYLQDFQI